MTDRPPVPRYWVLGDLKRDNAIGGYPEGWHNVVTACDYDALDAELNQALGALGYPVPSETPTGKYRCGLCVAKEAERQRLEIQLKAMTKNFLEA